MKRDGLLFKISISLVMFLLFNSIIFGTVHVEAASEVTCIKVKGYYDYDKAFKVLDILNAKRKQAGLGQLVMDKKLLDAAMKRSVEASVIFSHVRPDGTKWYTLDSKNMYGENIAAGREDPALTFDQWWNSPGHFKNMMKPTFKTIGVGCVEVNGIYYWCQEFGYSLNEEAKELDNRDDVISVNTLSGNLNVYSKTKKIKQMTGKTVKLEVFNRNKIFSYASIQIENQSLIWKSDNINVASVTKNGVVKCLCEGEAEISAVLSGTGEVVAEWDVVITGDGEYEDEDLDENGILKVSKCKVAKAKKIGKKKVKLSFKKTKNANGYELRYSKNSSMRGAKTKKSGKATITIKWNSKKKVLFVRVRAYRRLSNGTKVYGKWSKKTKIVL